MGGNISSTKSRRYSNQSLTLAYGSHVNLQVTFLFGASRDATMDKKRQILELRKRLEKTLASPALSNDESITSLVKSQLLRSSSCETEGGRSLDRVILFLLVFLEFQSRGGCINGVLFNFILFLFDTIRS